MPKYNVVNLEKKNVGELNLVDVVFGADVNVPLMHEAVKVCRANKRLGTASTKTRSEVSGSNVKPYRQKGTGRARHGSWKSPLFVGGGITFGPRPRDYTLKMNKSKKILALKSALSMKVKENKLLIIDAWVEKKKTKEMAHVLKSMGLENALLVLNEPTKWLERTVKNIPYIDVAYTNSLNTYNILAHDFLVCSKDVIAKIEEGLAK